MELSFSPTSKPLNWWKSEKEKQKTSIKQLNGVLLDRAGKLPSSSERGSRVTDESAEKRMIEKFKLWAQSWGFQFPTGGEIARKTQRTNPPKILIKWVSSNSKFGSPKFWWSNNHSKFQHIEALTYYKLSIPSNKNFENSNNEGKRN